MEKIAGELGAQAPIFNMIDWQQVALNIRTHYKPLSQVAKEVGSDWSHLNRLARGETKQPSFIVGVRLLDIHYDKCRHLHDKIGVIK